MAIGGQSWEDYKLNIRVFPSKTDMVNAAEEAYAYNNTKVLDANNQPDYDSLNPKYYLDNMVDEKIYQKPKELETGLAFFDKLLVETDMGGAFKKSRLRITDDTKGIFDFGLASQALYRSIEYYSKELEIESPNEFNGIRSGIIPNKYVNTKTVFQMKSFYYTSKVTNKTYELTQQQEGTKEMLELNPNAIIKSTSLGLRYAYPSSYEYKLSNGKVKKFNLKFKTRNKKSYLMFEKKGGKAKMVELYMPIHFDVKLPHILPLLLVAKYLQQAGVSTRISVLRMYHEGSQGYPPDLFVMYGYPIKDYGEEMDFNDMALNGVDTRWWSAVKVMVKALNDKDIIEKKGKYTDGTPLYAAAGGQAGNHEDYVEVFSRYRNWYMEQINLGLMPPLSVDKKLILFGGNFGGKGTAEELKVPIIKEFFRILDTVDLQFNNAEETCKRIYKREVTDKLAEFYQEKKKAVSTSFPIQPIYTTTQIVGLMEREKTKLTFGFKKYVQNLVLSTYSYPIGGMYAEPAESALKLEEEFAQKNEELDKFLKTI